MPAQLLLLISVQLNGKYQVLKTCMNFTNVSKKVKIATVVRAADWYSMLTVPIKKTATCMKKKKYTEKKMQEFHLSLCFSSLPLFHIFTWACDTGLAGEYLEGKFLLNT